MVSYSGLVTCDTTTYASSGLPPYYFKLLPERKMKGFEHPITVYQYVGITMKSIFGMALAMKMPENTSLLGRKKEIDLFVNCLEACNRFGQRQMLAFEGTRGSGKSRLLNHLAQLGRSAGCRYRVLPCSFGTLPLPTPDSHGTLQPLGQCTWALD